MGRRANAGLLQQIYDSIRSQPGIYPSTIGEQLKLKHKRIYHILPQLERAKLFVYEDDKGRLYPCK
jgi:hypothetical protein